MKRKEFDLTSLLNTRSKGAAVQVQEKENAFNVEMLDIEDLMPSKDNFYSTENIDELADAIELSGCIEQNLVVKPQAHGKYEIIAGHRRRLAILKLVQEGKEEYRKVPCRIKKESDAIRDRLSLIFTNATARQLTDWEKIKQVEELKEVLTEYKKALQEENKDKPKEEREKIGRIREIVARILNTSTTQIGRMEAISSHLSQDFKEEMKKGNIGISAAHELSRLDEEEQKKAYEQYEEKGELHIKDVKPEEKEEITEEQVEKVQEAIKDAIRGEVNRKIFKAFTLIKDSEIEIERILRNYFSKSFQGKKVDNGKYVYRFQMDGITLIDTETWENFLVDYPDLAKIVILMIENDQLIYDDSQEETKEEIKETRKEPQVAEVKKEEKKTLPWQQMGESKPLQKGAEFTTWIQEKYGMAQYTLIKKEIKGVLASSIEAEKGELPCLDDLENKLTNALSIWIMDKTKEYKRYLDGKI